MNLANGYLSFNTNNVETGSRRNNATYSRFNLQTRNTKAWGIDKMCFTSRTPNINRYNNQLVVNDGITSYPITVPEGQYDGAGLATALETVLTTDLPALGTWAVVFTAPNKFEIDNGGTTPFNFVETSEVSKNLASVMGWTVAFANDPLSDNFTGYGDLRYSKYVDFVSSDMNHMNPKDDYSTNNSTTNILGRIYIETSEQGVNTCYENTNIKMMKTGPYFDTGNIQIECRDEFGNTYYDPENVLEYSLLFITI
jgi:hypothetical protein